MQTHNVHTDTRALTRGLILDSEEMPAAARQVLLGLHLYANREGICEPGQSTLAKITGTSVSNIKRGLKYLIDKKLVEVVENRQSKNLPNILRIQWTLAQGEPRSTVNPGPVRTKPRVRVNQALAHGGLRSTSVEPKKKKKKVIRKIPKTERVEKSLRNMAFQILDFMDADNEPILPTELRTSLQRRGHDVSLGTCKALIGSWKSTRFFSER